MPLLVADLFVYPFVCLLCLGLPVLCCETVLRVGIFQFSSLDQKLPASFLLIKSYLLLSYKWTLLYEKITPVVVIVC